jgi:hypothetical protein
MLLISNVQPQIPAIWNLAFRKILIQAMQSVITLAKIRLTQQIRSDVELMRRVVVIGQPGRFGQAWCRLAATRLAHRLGLPCVHATESWADDGLDRGWVATVPAGELPRKLLAAADTAIWLHFSPLEVTRAWLRGLRTRLRDAFATMHAPRLSDISGSLAHMAWTPHLGKLLTDSGLRHLQVFHLRTPDQTEFWLRLQEQRLTEYRAPLARAA